MLVRWTILIDKDGAPHKSFNKEIRTLRDIDDMITFDVFDVDAWRVFLREFTQGGMKLPRKDSNGNPHAYAIRTIGTPKWMMEGYQQKVGKEIPFKKMVQLQLFPGMDNNGNKLPAERYGYID